MGTSNNKNSYIVANISDRSNIVKANIITKQEPIKSNLVREPFATTKIEGLIRIATDEEVINGISQNTAVTPSSLRKVTFFEYQQEILSEVWIINHNLNKKPSITVVDSAGSEIGCKKDYIDENTVKLYFNVKVKGKAYLN